MFLLLVLVVVHVDSGPIFMLAIANDLEAISNLDLI